MLSARAPTYLEALRNTETFLDRCVGFINWTRIKMQRSKGNGLDQKAVYFEHDQMHCLLYQSISAPDDVTSCIYGPVEVRIHYKELPRLSKYEDVLRNCLNTDG